jgi:hypothetical protein
MKWPVAPRVEMRCDTIPYFRVSPCYNKKPREIWVSDRHVEMLKIEL